MIKQSINRQGQTGAALIIGLTLLMALTIIGISTLSTTSLEHRMAGNMADTNIAFNTAESTGRNFTNTIIQDFNMAGLPDCGKRPDVEHCYRKNLPAYWWNVADWWDDHPALVHQETDADLKDNPDQPDPEIVTEYIKFEPNHLRVGHDYKAASGYIYYRVTTRAQGLSSNTESVTQQVVKKKLN